MKITKLQYDVLTVMYGWQVFGYWAGYETLRSELSERGVNVSMNRLKKVMQELKKLDLVVLVLQFNQYRTRIRGKGWRVTKIYSSFQSIEVES